MTKNQDRLLYIKEQLKQLNTKIVRAGLQKRYDKMVEEHKSGNLSVTPIDDDAWEIMLPKEKDKHLVEYYINKRCELQQLTEAIKRSGTGEKLAQWLDQPWVKITITTTALAEFTYRLIETAQASGLLFHEDNEL